MSKLKILGLFGLFLLLGRGVWAQSVSSITASVEGTNLVIQYTMTDLIDGQRFRIRLYSSTDEFSQPILSGISGAVGDDIRLSATNRIVMPNPQKTLGNITGPVTFQINTQLLYSPVEIAYPKTTAKVARGGKLKVGWRGGLDQDNIVFDLYRNDALIRENVFISDFNTRNVAVPIPKKMALGDGYRLDMRVESLDEPVAFSNIKVKRKFSIAERIIVGFVVLSAADYFLNPNSIIYYQILGKKDPLPEPPSVPNIQ